MILADPDSPVYMAGAMEASRPSQPHGLSDLAARCRRRTSPRTPGQRFRHQPGLAHPAGPATTSPAASFQPIAPAIRHNSPSRSTPRRPPEVSIAEEGS